MYSVWDTFLGGEGGCFLDEFPSIRFYSILFDGSMSECDCHHKSLIYQQVPTYSRQAPIKSHQPQAVTSFSFFR